MADLAQAVKAHGCGYETSDSQLKRRATDGEEEVSSIEEKHLKRMRRNRESAAMSRSRKKCYIEELEAKVAKLTETVNALQSENITLQHERAKLQQSRTTAGQDMHARSAPAWPRVHPPPPTPTPPNNPLHTHPSTTKPTPPPRPVSVWLTGRILPPPVLHYLLACAPSPPSALFAPCDVSMASCAARRLCRPASYSLVLCEDTLTPGSAGLIIFMCVRA